ncbi:MAG: hypothetical protein K0U66_04855 [Gammaproteobacteria bacterium]|nr:hypothetical protein [Gammaproteobacteria bacterium]
MGLLIDAVVVCSALFPPAPLSLSAALEVMLLWVGAFFVLLSFPPAPLSLCGALEVRLLVLFLGFLFFLIFSF